MVSGEMNSMLQSSSGSSSARDRTNEFMNTIRTLQGQQHVQSGGYNQQVAPQDRHGQLGKLGYNRCYSFLTLVIDERTSLISMLTPTFVSIAQRSREFMTIARSIGKDIANTYTKLEKLTLLAKRKTIAFDDRPAEIQNLTFIIKEDMNQLNRQIGQVFLIDCG